MTTPPLFDPHPLPVPPSALGESPFWHPQEQALYWCDIPGRTLHRYQPATNVHDSWGFDTEVASGAPLLGGGLLLALRSGLWRFDPADRGLRLLAAAPYDDPQLRFNDGKADPAGRFWVGTYHEQRQPLAALYRYAGGELQRMVPDAVASNGLAWSPDGATLYWSDTRAHTVWAFDFDPADGALSNRRVFAQFAPRAEGQAPAHYGGRPDGAAVDTEGAYWVAMFEGARLLRLAPDGRVLREVKLPVQCATMPCFGGADLKTLYATTARAHRPAAELARQPWAGCVLQLRVDVAGLPVNFAAP